MTSANSSAPNGIQATILEQDFHDEMASLYRRTGEATGYWPNYFRRRVLRVGGLVFAKELLAPGRETTGFEKLVEARRPDLSVEAIALLPRYATLFTAAECDVARGRLAELPESAFPSTADTSKLADEPWEEDYPEGAVQSVQVNRYERNAKARQACVAHHGAFCAVCELDFRQRYGDIGEGFIHVHHKRPLRTLGKSRRVNPVTDLVPVCPNCHAMIHRRNPPLDVEDLRRILRDRESD
jgi:5-methylcytosine-specific restriction enzyme A